MLDVRRSRSMSPILKLLALGQLASWSASLHLPTCRWAGYSISPKVSGTKATLPVSLLGGDVTRARDITIAVTALGSLEGRDPVLRSGARPGNLVAIHGRLGWAAAGLVVLGRGAHRGSWSRRNGCRRSITALVLLPLEREPPP